MKPRKSFIYRIYRKKDIEKVESKIEQFGVSKKYDTAKFMNIRLYSSVLLFLFCFLFLDTGPLLAPIITVIWYFFIGYAMLDEPLGKRGKKLENEAYYYFEVLTLALESGRNLENSIKMACKYIDSEISSEFKEVLKETAYGKTLSECLSNMTKKIPSMTINNIILNMQQSSMFGNNIVDTMYNQLSFLKDKQIMDIKSEINKLPNKISVFSVLFFVPLILLIILGPILVDLLS